MNALIFAAFWIWTNLNSQVQWSPSQPYPGSYLTNSIYQADVPPTHPNPDYTYYWWLDLIARKYMIPSQGLPVNPQALTIAILTALNSETNGVTAAKIGSDGTSAAFCYQQLGGDTRDYSIVPPATVSQ